MACVVRTAGERIRRLSEGWELVELAAGAATTPHDLERLRPRCVPAIVPGTVGQALYGSAATSLAARADLDELDFWYRTRFAGPRGRARLRFGGLATLADVFLNGQLLFQANDLFSTYEHEVTGLCKGDDELAIRFRALRSEPRGTRPRYKARFVEDQSLRRVRTTLFGRMPGFTPMLPPVGPFRAIELVESAELVVTAADVRARVCGDGGVVAATLVVEGSSRVAGTLRVGDAETALRASPASGTSAMLSGQIALAHVDRWWPHTHGTQPLYPVCATLELDGRAIEVDLGRTGFREIELRTDDGGFAISVNGVPVFCRGACWLPLDPLSLDGSADDLEGTLALARQSGMNMLRAVANGVYPEQRFYELCEELGILIWQDFAFCRLDYPDDAEFLEIVEREARQLLDRTQLSPALAVLCGNSEVEQQVAMLGLPPELARSSLFHRLLPESCGELRPDVPYWPSTPSGGALPFHVDRGTSHYFGVGAYLRDPSDARSSDVRFATECLAFSNVPERRLVEQVLGDEGPGQLRWKATVSRDRGASWDFEDVREHYLETYFKLDARALRAADPERWLELGRAATGETMAAAISEWRRARSRCRGALIWHLRDFVCGAGCGLIDATGSPKAAYFYVARAFQPIALFLIDEGLNGLRAHALNETARPLAAELGVSVYRDGRTCIASAVTAVALPPRSAVELSVDALLGSFLDTTYAYRFGAPGHDVVAARLVEVVSGAELARAQYLPLGLSAGRRSDVEILASTCSCPAGYLLEVRADAFVHAVHVEAKGFRPSDNYFHLEPGRAKAIVLARGGDPQRPLAARVSALDVASTLTLTATAEAARSA